MHFVRGAGSPRWSRRQAARGDGREQHEQRIARAGVDAVRRRVEARRHHLSPERRLRKLRKRARGDRIELASCGIAIDIRSQSGDRLVGLELLRRGRGEREPNVRVPAAREAFPPRRHHADDDVRLVFEGQDAAEHVVRTAVVALPRFVAEHDDGRRAGLRVGGREAATEHGEIPKKPGKPKVISIPRRRHARRSRRTPEHCAG